MFGGRGDRWWRLVRRCWHLCCLPMPIMISSFMQSVFMETRLLLAGRLTLPVDQAIESKIPMDTHEHLAIPQTKRIAIG